jgi:hypothetical protein
MLTARRNKGQRLTTALLTANIVARRNSGQHHTFIAPPTGKEKSLKLDGIRTLDHAACILFGIKITLPGSVQEFLGAFAKSRKVIISFIVSVSPSVRMEQLCMLLLVVLCVLW